MTCYYPIKAVKDYGRPNPSGKPAILFNKKNASGNSEEINLPCGRCIGCRIDRSRQWAIRCVHEASMYEDNCFITLTFNEENLNEHGSLVKSDFQKFMKRLRKRYKGKKIRYFHCGEYGAKLSRPHHHACLFNHDFEDKEYWRTKKGVRLYRSEILESLWPFGFCTIGAVTFKSAAYVARYIMKKVNGGQAEEHYRVVDEETGEVLTRQPEYTTMSRRPGIARDWYEKFKEDLKKDFLTINGKKMNIPKYYDQIREIEDPVSMEKIKKRRKNHALTRKEEQRLVRLKVRKRIQEKRCINLKREYEDDNEHL